MLFQLWQEWKEYCLHQSTILSSLQLPMLITSEIEMSMPYFQPFIAEEEALENYLGMYALINHYLINLIT